MEPSEIFAALKAPFDPKAISWRVGSTNGDKTSGLALAYIDARNLMERLDEVVGPENWKDSYVETVRGRIICTISIRIGGEWISKSDGAGDTDVEGDKGAISDAFKRTGVKWGPARYLYDLDNVWADIVPAGKSFRFKDPASLYKKLPAWAIPAGAKLPTPKPEHKPDPVLTPFGVAEKWGNQYWSKIQGTGNAAAWKSAMESGNMTTIEAVQNAVRENRMYERKIDTSPVSDNDIP